MTIASSDGIAPTVVEHLRLTLDGGIGGCLAREVRILRRREANNDTRIEREFDLLGTDVAVPMFENDQLLGVLSFSGKITGEPMANEELELIYQLASQLSQAMRNAQLSERVAAQQRLLGEVLAHVHSGVLVVDHEERILAVNDRLRALLELGKDNKKALYATQLIITLGNQAACVHASVPQPARLLRATGRPHPQLRRSENLRAPQSV